MNRDQKTAVVQELASQIRAADAVLAVDYRGISVEQAAELRIRLREADARFRVVKNSLSERAADEAGAGDLKPLLVGPTALTFVSGDAALAAKALSEVARRLNLLEFKGGLLNGSALSADDVRSIARLPPRDVLQAQLVGTIAAPLTGLARTLNALVGGLAIQLKAIADLDPPVLSAGGEAAATPAPEPAGSGGEATAAPVPERSEGGDEATATPAPEPAGSGGEATAVPAPEPSEDGDEATAPAPEPTEDGSEAAAAPAPDASESATETATEPAADADKEEE